MAWLDVANRCRLTLGPLWEITTVGDNSSSIIFLLIPVLLILMLVFQRRTVRRQTELVQSQLAPGVEVMTGSGLIGTVRALRDEHVDVEIAPGIVTRWVRPAIARVIQPSRPDDEQTEPPVVRDDGPL